MLHKKSDRLLLFSALAVLILGFSIHSYADEEAGNRTYVIASEYGQFYAKSVPSESYGLKGQTKVYRVGKEEDVLIQTYDWYSPRIFLEGFGDVYVVQMGPWHRGHRASSEHHAIAFYKNDKLLKKYSTLGIVGSEDNISRSVSHYTIFSNIQGFRRPFGNQLIFEVETHEGVVLAFDTDSGEILTKEQENIRKQLYEAQVTIRQIQWKWYEENKDSTPDIDNVLITEDMLRNYDPGNFPSLPDGYRYVPSAIWKPINFEQQKEE